MGKLIDRTRLFEEKQKYVKEEQRSRAIRRLIRYSQSAWKDRGDDNNEAPKTLD